MSTSVRPGRRRVRPSRHMWSTTLFAIYCIFATIQASVATHLPLIHEARHHHRRSHYVPGSNVDIFDRRNNGHSTSGYQSPFTRRFPAPTLEDTVRRIKLVDQDGDRRLSLEEVEFAVNFPWPNEQEAWRARKVLDMQEPEVIFNLADSNRDGYLDAQEVHSAMLEHHFAILKRDNPSKTGSDTQKCESLISKVESCPMRNTLSCASHLNVFQRSCSPEQSNAVERCIQRSSCTDLCSCIRTAEDYAILGHQSSSALMDPSRNMNNLQERNPFLLGALLFGLFSIGLDYIDDVLSSHKIEEASWLNVYLWDKKNPPRDCAISVFWSDHCGFINTRESATCSQDGTRLYAHSCWDWWRTGSQTCSVVKCRSLCYKVNNGGCPCSFFDYKEVKNVQFSGEILQKTQETPIDCSRRCGSDARCGVFEVPPWSGDANAESCITRRGGGTVTALVGVNSYVRVSGYPLTCSLNLAFEDESTGPDIFSRSLQAHANVTSIEADELFARQSGNDKPPAILPFRDERTLFALLVYWYFRGNMASQPVMQPNRVTAMADVAQYRFPPVTATALTAANRNGGRWNTLEIVTRLMDTFRRFINPNNPITPQDWLASARDNGPDLFRRLFPDNLIDVVRTNDEVLRQSDSNWDFGDPMDLNLNPRSGLQLLFERNTGFYQRGGVGPVTLETAFILATQMAGVNWDRVRADYTTHPRQRYWFSLNVGGTRDIGGACFEASTPRENDVPLTRNMGSVNVDFRAQADNSVSQGVYVVFDMEPSRPMTENRKLFVFVIHTVDPESRVQASNQVFESPAYNTYDAPTRRLGADEEEQPRGTYGSPPTRTRALAHAHAAVIDSTTFQQYLDTYGSVSRFPIYDQIGTFHFYINPEDTTSAFPRFGSL